MVTVQKRLLSIASLLLAGVLAVLVQRVDPRFIYVTHR